jgi:hypothetical protein
MPNADDLKKVLDLRYEWEHSEIETKPEREKLYLAHLDEAYREAAAVKPSLSKRTFIGAIDFMYKAHRQARRKSEMGSIPPYQRGK